MGRGRTKNPLQLTPGEHDVLSGYVRSGKTPQRLALRANIILACAQGLENKVVAVRLGVTEETVGKWRSRFIRQRLKGLDDKPRTGAPRKGPPNELSNELYC